MPTTYRCPHCKQALALLEMHINTNVPCPACGQWFFAASASSNVPPIQKHPAPSTTFSPEVLNSSVKPNTTQRITGSTRFLYGICAAAGLLIAGVIGFFMLQDSEQASNPETTAKTPIINPLPLTLSTPPDAKKILEDEISTSKSEESELNLELKNLSAELETLRTEAQNRKTEAEAMNRERSTLVGEAK